MLGEGVSTIIEGDRKYENEGEVLKNFLNPENLFFHNVAQCPGTLHNVKVCCMSPITCYQTVFP